MSLFSPFLFLFLSFLSFFLFLTFSFFSSPLFLFLSFLLGANANLLDQTCLLPNFPSTSLFPLLTNRGANGKGLLRDFRNCGGLSEGSPGNGRLKLRVAVGLGGGRGGAQMIQKCVLGCVLVLDTVAKLIGAFGFWGFG